MVSMQRSVIKIESINSKKCELCVRTDVVKIYKYFKIEFYWFYLILAMQYLFSYDISFSFDVYWNYIFRC